MATRFTSLGWMLAVVLASGPIVARASSAQMPPLVQAAKTGDVEIIESDGRPNEITLISITNLFPVRYLKPLKLFEEKYRRRIDIGSVHEISARRFASHATLIALKTRDECVLAVQSGRADCVIMAVNLGLTAIKKNPALGEFQMLHQPRIQLPTCMGVRKEANKDWRDFLNAWVDYNRGIQQIREWLYGGLAINGVKPEDIPPDVEL